jgi:AsmA protein
MSKPNKFKNSFIKLLKWTLAIIVFLVICMFAIPSIFNDAIANEIKKGLNDNLETELQFKGSEISFFNHFPSLTFSFQEVNLAGTAPFEKDALVTARELGFGINVFKLIFSNRVFINETYLTDCNIQLIKNKLGQNNYSIYTTTDSTVTTADTTSSGIRLNLKHINIENATLHYKDEESGISVIAEGLNYNGRGGLKDGKIKLGSKLEIASVNVTFDNIDYLKGKKLKAKSFTIYDTKNLSIELDENTIALNDLEVNFHGKLDVFDEGVAYDLLFNTEEGTIQDVISALPPEYVIWSNEVSLQGDLDAKLQLTGYSGIVPAKSAIDRTNLEVKIYDGNIKHKSAQQAIENLFVDFKGSLKNDYFDINIKKLDFKLDEQKTNGQIVARGKSDSLYIKSNINTILDLSTLNQSLSVPGYNFKGKLTSNISVDGIYEPKSSKFPKTDSKFKVTDGFLKTAQYPEPIKNIEIEAVIQNNGTNYESASLTVNTFNFSFLDNDFYSSGFFKNFDNPEYLINAKGAIDFTSLNQVITLPISIKQGTINADLNLNGQLQNSLTENKNSGTLEVKGIEITTALLQFPVLIEEGMFSFLNDRMAFSKLNIKHQSSDATMNGYFQNYLDYALMSDGILLGDINLKANKIDITEFFPKEETEQKLDSIVDINSVNEVVNGVMQVPEKIDLTLQTQIDSLKYNLLNITKLSGTLAIKDKTLFLKNSTLNLVDGTAQVDGVYQPIDAKKALFTMNIKAENFNIEKGYNSVAIFKELAPAAAQASGVVSIDYDLSGTLNEEMLPVFNELKGKGTLKAHSIKFDGYKLMGKVSEKSGFETLNNPEVSEIIINSELENNILTLERFKFKVRPFKLRAEGQTSLDGEMSLKLRIGLPPFGLIGIPVVVEGNSDDFDVKVGTKSKDLDSLDDAENNYSEEDLIRMNMLKDSIRDGMSIDEINKMQQKIESIKLDSLLLPTQAIDSLNLN